MILTEEIAFSYEHQIAGPELQDEMIYIKDLFTFPDFNQSALEKFVAIIPIIHRAPNAHNIQEGQD